MEGRRQHLARYRAGSVRPAAKPVVAVLSVDAARHPDLNTQSIEDYAAGKLAVLTLGEYFARRHFAPHLLRDYLAPMGAAIWSAPSDQMLDFPAENFVAFFSNHRLLQYDRPVWRTVKGGSRSYVEKLTSAFRGQLRLGCAR